MTYPSSDVNTTNADAGTDSPATFRTDVLDLIQKFNLLRNHISTFVQGLLTSANAAAARATLGALGASDTIANATTAANALGVGQTWTNVLTTPGRVIGTTYTNSTGRSIMVSVSTFGGGYLIGYIGAVMVSVGGSDNVTTNHQYASHVFVVPNLGTYKLDASLPHSQSLVTWAELR